MCSIVCRSKAARELKAVKYIATWKCIGSMHVYYDHPTTGDGVTPLLAMGLKQYYFEAVDQTTAAVWQVDYILFSTNVTTATVHA